MHFLPKLGLLLFISYGRKEVAGLHDRMLKMMPPQGKAKRQ